MLSAPCCTLPLAGPRHVTPLDWRMLTVPLLTSKIILQLERASGVLVLNTAIHAPFAVKKLRRAVRQGGREG